MAEKISVQIALEGGKEVEQQLAAIGEAGNKAFTQVGQSSETAAEGISKSGDAADKAAESTSRLSLETVKTSAEIAAATAKIALHGVEIVQAVRHHNTLIQSLIKLASGFSTTSRVIAAFTPELALVGVTAGSTAAAVAAGVLAFEAAEKVITKFAAGAENLNNTLQTLAATSGESFDKLQNGQAAFEQIGIKAETFRSTIAKVNETLAATQTKGLTTGMKDIVALVNQIAAGNKNIKFADWVTAEDKVKGVAIAMKQAADSGKDATQVLLEFIRNADLATGIKVGAAFGLSEADVDRVRRLGENISDLTQRIAGAPPLISPEAAANLDKMRTSIQNADSAWARFKQSLDSTIFTSLAANFSSTMNDMKAAALNGAAAIVEALNQAGRTFAKPPPEFTAALTTAGQLLQNAVTGLNSVVANLVGAAMQKAGASAAQIQAVQDQINGVATAATTAGEAAQTAGVMFTSFGTLAQEGANTAQAGVQKGVQIWTQWGTAASQAGDKAAEGLGKVGPAAQSGADKVSALATQIAGIAWDTIARAGVAAWNAITGAIQGAIDKVLQFIGLKPSAPASGRGAPAMAGGGLLGGRGTGTSDSNLAWVSRGEYIMPASAVRQPGVLALLEAMRRLGGIPGYAEGGVVGAVSGDGTTIATGFNNLTDAVKSMGFELAEMRAFMFLSEDNCKNENEKTREKMDEKTPTDIFVEALIRKLGNLPEDAFGPRDHAAGGLLGGRGTGTSDSNLAWVSRGEHIMPAAVVRRPGVLSLLETLRRSGRIPGFAAGGQVGDIPAKIIQVFDAIDAANKSNLATMWNISQSILSAGRSMDQSLLGIQSMLRTPGRRAGGLLGGRGTGTSDSNLAWVSRGEHIMPARAVAQPGVLAFLELLRRSGGNLSAVLNGMGRFALGGMVPRMPAFAAGGLAGGSHVTIQFPGLPAIGGLRASSDVVDQLHRAAALAQVRSGGRKPSRYS